MTDQAPMDPMVEFMIQNNPKDVFEARALTDMLLMSLNENLPKIGATHDGILLQGHENEALTADIHVPDSQGPYPVVLMFHGGGFISGSTKTHRKLGFRMAEAGFLVVNVAYRLAPECPFPAAFEDCRQALGWALQHVAEYGGDPERIALMGDSVGGNFAALTAATQPAGSVKALALLYPAVDLEGWPAMAAEVPPGVPNMVAMFLESYLGENYAERVADPHVSPWHLAASYPPTVLVCGSLDSWVVEGCHKLAATLETANIENTALFYEGMPHGFIQLEEQFEQAGQALQEVIGFLNKRLT